MARASGRITYDFQHCVNKIESRQQREVRRAAEERRAEAAAAGQNARSNLLVEELEPPAISELSPTRSPTLREGLPQSSRDQEAPFLRPELPATPPASLLGGHSDNGNGEVGTGGYLSFQNIISNLRDQLQNKKREYDQGLDEIKRLRQEIKDKEAELRVLRDSQIAAIHQGQLDEAKRQGERYNLLSDVLKAVQEEKNKATMQLEEKEAEIDELRGQLRQARTVADEQQQQQQPQPHVPELEPEPNAVSRSEAVDNDNRSIERSSTARSQSRSNQNGRSERGSQRNGYTGYLVRSRRVSGSSSNRPKNELVRTRRVSHSLAWSIS